MTNPSTPQETPMDEIMQAQYDALFADEAAAQARFAHIVALLTTLTHA